MILLKLKTDKEFIECFDTEEAAQKYAEEFLKANEKWKEGIISEYGYSDSVESFFQFKEVKND